VRALRCARAGRGAVLNATAQQVFSCDRMQKVVLHSCGDGSHARIAERRASSLAAGTSEWCGRGGPQQAAMRITGLPPIAQPGIIDLSPMLCPAVVRGGGGRGRAVHVRARRAVRARAARLCGLRAVRGRARPAGGGGRGCGGGRCCAAPCPWPGCGGSWCSSRAHPMHDAASACNQEDMTATCNGSTVTQSPTALRHHISLSSRAPPPSNTLPVHTGAGREHRRRCSMLSPSASGACCAGEAAEQGGRSRATSSEARDEGALSASASPPRPASTGTRPAAARGGGMAGCL